MSHLEQHHGICNPEKKKTARLIKLNNSTQYNYSLTGDYRDSVDLIGRGLRHILL